MAEKLLAEWFLTDRWRGSSAALLPMEPRGLYREMLSEAWRRGARLPNSPEAIQRAIGASADEWARCWPQVAPYWRVNGEWLINDTQAEVYADAKARSDKATARGLRGAQATAQARAQAPAQAKPEPPLKHQPPSPSPSPSPSLPRTTTESSNQRPINARSPHIAAGERPKWEVEALRLTREIAKAENLDGAAVIAEAADYQGATRVKTDPAGMTEGRLVATVLALRKRAAKHRPADPAAPLLAPAEAWIEANGGREHLARECAEACGWTENAGPRAAWRSKRGVPPDLEAGIAKALHWEIRKAIEAHNGQRVSA